MELNEDIDEILPYKVKYVLLVLNMKCFFRCKMCDIWKNELPDIQLPLSIYRKFFSDLKKIKGHDTFVNLGGGELLMNKNIFEIISYATENRFFTNLNTNGWLLGERNIKRIFDSGLNAIGFSLDGSTPELHDFIRGYPGSYDRLFKNAKKLKEYFKKNGKNINITVCCTIMSLNLHDIINVVELVKDTAFIDSIVFGAVTAPFANQNISDKLMGEQDKYWFEQKQYNSLWPKDINQIIEVYSKLIKFKNKGYKIGNHEHRLRMQLYYFTNPKKRLSSAVCNVNRNLIIEQNGDVFHCQIKKEKIGNITKDSISNIWNSFHAIKMRRKVIECKANCHELINCDSTNSREISALIL